ncbi:MAG: sulfite exporter TauE/SafE family protein [Bacteroidia bacterium]|nr:sulfite exporter TauE/SafE family protein [Bacteroidia bacterium]NNC86353.1 sulfite exporter TauE/SafE family protein [Bacteroidia bacterium]NNM15646.1 sulfite exporter TauE/SafE family protein [Bacteroidia bacterium]
MNIEILSALSLGFIGSMHCIGMCGPIALVVPLNRKSTLTMTSGALSYNIGRIFTYFIFGLLFGLIGSSLALGGMQRSVSVALGILIIISALLPGLVTRYFNVIPIIAKGTNRLKSALSDLFKQKSLSSLFVIGLLNGLLPCGLVYVAIAGAIVDGSVLGGGLFMAAFGAGTIPVMFAIPMLGKFVSDANRRRLMRIFPIILILVGILFIMRGMNENIPLFVK